MRAWRSKATLRARGSSLLSEGVWRNGSASDSRSEGWEFESLCPHLPLSVANKRDTLAVKNRQSTQAALLPGPRTAEAREEARGLARI